MQAPAMQPQVSHEMWYAWYAQQAQLWAAYNNAQAGAGGMGTNMPGGGGRQQARPNQQAPRKAAPRGQAMAARYLAQANTPALRCEPCARSFVTTADLKAHLKSHQQCRVEGCAFAASAKALKDHYAEAHHLEPDGVTPLPPEEAKVSLPLSAAEQADVERYIAERRKNYPTAGNVARKRTEAEAAAEAGRDDGCDDEGARERRRRLLEVLKKQRELGLCKLAGTEGLAAATLRQEKRERTHMADVDDAGARKKCARTERSAEPHGDDALAMLRGYGSSSSEQDDDEEEEEGGKNDQGEAEGAKITDDARDEADANVDVTPAEHRPPPPPQPNRPFVPHRAQTLLEKLLRREVRRERGWVLQALRFFTRNDEYFSHAVGGVAHLPTTEDDE